MLGLPFLAACVSESMWAHRPPNTRSEANDPHSADPIRLENFDPARLGVAIFNATNEERRLHRLPPFAHLKRLDDAADIQASDNALKGAASHGNFITAWATPFDRVISVGLNAGSVAENAALLPLLNLDPSHGYYERPTPEGKAIVDSQSGTVVTPHTYASFADAIVRAWMNSPGHRANIMNPRFRFLGCSARPTKSVTGLDLIAGIQVFYSAER